MEMLVSGRVHDESPTAIERVCSSRCRSQLRGLAANPVDSPTDLGQVRLWPIRRPAGRPSISVRTAEQTPIDGLVAMLIEGIQHSPKLACLRLDELGPNVRA